LVLRAELELDATVRGLKERLAIAETGAGNFLPDNISFCYVAVISIE
jgi:hypothetical protein